MMTLFINVTRRKIIVLWITHERDEFAIEKIVDILLENNFNVTKKHTSNDYTSQEAYYSWFITITNLEDLLAINNLVKEKFYIEISFTCLFSSDASMWFYDKQ